MVFSDDTTSGHDTTFGHNSTFSYNTTSDHDKTWHRKQSGHTSYEPVGISSTPQSTVPLHADGDYHHDHHDHHDNHGKHENHDNHGHYPNGKSGTLFYGVYSMERGYGDHFYAQELERIDASIASLYKEQPVLFHPRTEWPKSAKKPPNARDASFDDYNDLGRIGWFIGHSDEWPMHVLHVHSFFYRLREREWATRGGLFDRRTGVLWFLDSMAGNRKACAKAVGLLWRLFLDNIGLPFNFLLVVPEVTPQDDGWSCGYITLVNALLMIRGCVGQSLRDMTETCRLDEIPVDDGTVNRPHDYFSLEKSDILYLDWCGIAETRSKAVNFMLSALKHMAANELGLIRGMLRGDDGPGTPAVDLRPYSSWAKITALQPGLSAIGGPIPFKIELSVREHAERIFDNPPSTECWAWPTAAQMPLLGEFARTLPRDLPTRRFEITALLRHVKSGYPGLSSPFEAPSVVSLGKTKRMSESLHEIDSRLRRTTGFSAS
ncbi:hypothetical protein LEL_10772 [Akanthomyces lecanii RCEF 1005]|uniref:Uncharacterized protein n=1 Tax=Akanthomyces lecanii RCEF 1005 TaxID=1081108 RepID=A0A167TSA8_CORDF|nr:hypothetical protein LEL_10772 [Akanthomyces lecanii RCEF 1005]